MTIHRVGDPDPTDGYDGTSDACYDQHPEGYACTRWPAPHDGDHIAGDREKIVAVWPQEQSCV